MNQYEPMEDNSMSHDPKNHDAHAEQPTYRVPEQKSDGREYINPDGSYGFIYSRRENTAEVKSRRYRSALIVVSAVLAAVLLAVGSCVGAMFAFGSLHDGEERDSLDAPEEAGTSDGLYIADESSTDGSFSEEISGDAVGETGQIPGGIGSTEPVDITDLPENATIHKLPPERVDRDGDGRADISYDANGEVLTSAGEDAVSVATVVARVAASVVEITTETISQSGFLGQYITSGAGSGVIISEDGFIVTNHHVIDGASTITVRLNDGTEYPATLVGSDEDTDVAVLWINPDGRKLTVATLGASYDLVVGEDILAIGNPLGSLGGTVTEGMISATARQISVGNTEMTLLQVSAPINPGNSGGGLFNLAGELVGVVNAKMSSEEIEGLGFAIPIDAAYEVILELIDHGYVSGRPALGVSLLEVSSWRNTYVCVRSRDHEVLRYDDLILSIDGVEISSIADLVAAIRRKEIGDTVEIIVYRDQSRETVTVTLVEHIPQSNSD